MEGETDKRARLLIVQYRLVHTRAVSVVLPAGSVVNDKTKHGNWATTALKLAKCTFKMVRSIKSHRSLKVFLFEMYFTERADGPVRTSPL